MTTIFSTSTPIILLTPFQYLLSSRYGVKYYLKCLNYIACCLRTQPYWPMTSGAQMGGSTRFMETHEQLLAIISIDFIWFWHMMPWTDHLGPSVRMAGSPPAWWQATGHWQSGTGGRRRVGGVELAEYPATKPRHSQQQLSHLTNLGIDSLGQIKWYKMKLNESIEIKELNMA